MATYYVYYILFFNMQNWLGYTLLSLQGSTNMASLGADLQLTMRCHNYIVAINHAK